MVIKQNCQQNIELTIAFDTEEEVSFSNITKIEFCFGDGNKNKRITKTWVNSETFINTFINKVDSDDARIIKFVIMLTENDTKRWTSPMPIQARIVYNSNGGELGLLTGIVYCSVLPCLSDSNLITGGA